MMSPENDFFHVAKSLDVVLTLLVGCQEAHPACKHLKTHYLGPKNQNLLQLLPDIFILNNTRKKFSSGSCEKDVNAMYVLL